MVKLWDVEQERVVHSLPYGKRLPTAFPPEEERLAPDRHLLVPSSSPGLVSALAFSSDGRRLATASADATITIWDVASGQAGLTIRLPAQPAHLLAFSPDSHLLACACERAGAVLIFDATPIRP